MYFRKIVISRTEAGQNKESLGRGLAQWTMGAFPTLYFDRLTKASRPIGKPSAFPPTLRTQDKYAGIGKTKRRSAIVSCSPFVFRQPSGSQEVCMWEHVAKTSAQNLGTGHFYLPYPACSFKARGRLHLHITRIKPKTGLESFFSSSKSQPFKGQISLKVDMKRTESDIPLQ